MAQPQPIELESLSPNEIDYVRKNIEEVRTTELVAGSFWMLDYSSFLTSIVAFACNFNL